MHFPYLTPHHLVFVLFSALFVAVLLGFSSLLRLIVPERSYGFLVSLLWASLLSLSVVCDYMELSPAVFGGILLALIILYTVSLRRSGRLTVAEWRRTNSICDIGSVYLTWVLGFSALLFNLIFFVPLDAVVTGHFICNDSVIHALLSEGLKELRGYSLDPFYYTAEYRGIGSWLYYVNRGLFNVDVPKIILPATLFTCSFLVFVGEYISSWCGVRSRYARGVASIALVTPYLLVITSYILFVGQVVVFPIVLFSVFQVIAISSGRCTLFDLASLFISVIALLGIYGVFPVSVVVIAAALTIVWWCVEKGSLNFVQPAFKACCEALSSVRAFLLLAILVVIALPPLTMALKMLFLQGRSGGSTGTDILTSVGNLPGGYLSVFHLTGFWPEFADYRASFDGDLSFINYILFALLALQIVVITKGINARASVILLLSFLIPTILSGVRSKGQYIHFKYLFFACSVFQFVFLLAVIELLRRSESLRGARVIRPIVNSAIVLYLLAMLAFPALQFARIPSVNEGDLKELSALRKHYFKKSDVLVLSKEDWLQYYVRGVGDFVPLTLYIPQSYHGQPIDYLIIDRAYEGDATTYLEGFPELRTKYSHRDTRCFKELSARFTVLNVHCSDKNGAEAKGHG